MKNKRNLNIKWLLLQNDQNADTTLLHSHDELAVSSLSKGISRTLNFHENIDTEGTQTPNFLYWERAPYQLN